LEPGLERWDAGGTPARARWHMTLSVLLRLLPGPLAAGQLVGEVEVVRTGDRAKVRNTQELVAYLQQRAQAAPPAVSFDQPRT
jgi:hypothetical protein